MRSAPFGRQLMPRLWLIQMLPARSCVMALMCMFVSPEAWSYTVACCPGLVPMQMSPSLDAAHMRPPESQKRWAKALVGRCSFPVFSVRYHANSFIFGENTCMPMP